MTFPVLSDVRFSARDRFSGALTSALDRDRVDNGAEAQELLEGMPDLTAGLDTPLKKIIK